MDQLVVGLGFFTHDTSIALMRGGEVLYAAEQERFDRVKHSHALPVDALEQGLQFIGAHFDDIDVFVLNHEPALAFSRYMKYIFTNLPKTLKMLFDPHRTKMAWQKKGYRKRLKKHFDGKRKDQRWVTISHHLAHASSAYYRSGYKDAAVITSDDMGEMDSVDWFLARGLKIRCVRQTYYPDSLAAVFSAVTDFLGYPIHSGEGTVMGLAALGEQGNEIGPAKELQNAIQLEDDGGIKVDQTLFAYPTLPLVHCNLVSEKFISMFGLPRQRGEKHTDEQMKLAYHVQQLSDRVMLHMTRHLKKTTDSENLCLAGGSALNGYSNTKILQDGKFKKLYVQPAANDGGTALGAALYYSHHILGLQPKGDSASSYLGPQFSDQECEVEAQAASLNYRKVEDITSAVARLLAQDKVVGWFQGRMEFGPRSLGNRSILANACSPIMKDYINKKIKHREWFRPFAPSVLKEKAPLYFKMPCDDLPYMLFIVDVKEEWREKIPAICHHDGTSRVQTVTEHSNSLYAKLLEKVEEEIGVAMVLNTSFNGRGEPIVCTPQEAVASFLKLKLDALALGNILILPREDDD